MKAKTTSGGGRGFSLVELLVVVAIIGIGALVSLPALHKLILRNRVLGVVRDAKSHLHAARQEAIKFGTPVVMQADFNTDEFVIYADVPFAGDTAGQFVYNPDTTKTFRTRDYVVARLPLPAPGVAFWGATDGGPKGANAIVGFTDIGQPGPNVAVLLPDGSIRDIGAWRISDNQGNFFEIRVDPAATARAVVRKYHDSPPWGGLPDYFPAGRHQSTGDPLWRWY